LSRLFSFLAIHSRYTLFFIVMAIATASSPAPVRAESEVFPIPDIIKNNVAFWIRIYTEVSLQEGLLHDRDYPQVVYEKSPTGDRTGKARSEYLSGRMKIYSDAIAKVRDSSQEKWGTVEKQVAEMFKNLPKEALADAETRIRHQTGQRERFRQGFERSGMYLDTIAAIMKKHGVPEELKYLPHVESSFDATAYSRVGAAGLWQFMRSTGRGYLRIDYMIDERSDPILSSVAAAKFLRNNHDILQSWPLAITGYNSGPNGMRRAIETLGTRDIAIILEKHESSSFKFASKNFYACFLAVLAIMEQPDKYLKGVKPRPRWEATSIRVPFAIKPAALCKSLGVSEQDFKRLNPSFRPVVFNEQRPIPAGYAVNLPGTINGAEALAAISAGTPPPQRAAAARELEHETNDGYYKVAGGDNLQAISRRLGVSMADLAEANNITNSSRIYVGQVLRVPLPSASTPAAAASTVKTDTMRIAPIPAPDTAKTAAAPARKPDTAKASVSTPPKPDTAKAVAVPTKKPDTVRTAPKPVPPPEPPVLSNVRLTIKWPAPAPKKAEATVKAMPAAKDTVKAAKAPPPKDTAAAEPTLADVLSAAAAVRVAEPGPAPDPDPSGKPSTDTRFDADAYDLTVRVTPAAARIRVNVDENITQIASWMRAYVADIRTANDMGPNDALTPGRLINIPTTSSSHINKFETSRLQYHMAIEEDFFARYDVTDFDQLTVKSGDNLWRICRAAQIPMWLLRKYNRGPNFYNLQPGNRLWIPKIAPKADTVEGMNLFDDTVTESDE